jgi:hypothetical protein
MMSILVVQVLHEGMVFAADRNVITTNWDGTEKQEDLAEKVFRWPNDHTLFGSVGEVDVGGVPIREWLLLRSRKYAALGDLATIARELKDEIQQQRIEDEKGKKAEGLIIHLGAFRKRDEYMVPEVYYITNAYDLGRFGYTKITKEYGCSEQFWEKFNSTHVSEIRRELKVRAKNFKPFWFHQGFDLLTFNVLESAIRSSFELLCKHHPNHDIPTDLAGWEKHIKFQILMYGSYFTAFHDESDRYVGGGVDVVSIPWPST